jgi:CBS domain-containing protein
MVRPGPATRRPTGKGSPWRHRADRAFFLTASRDGGYTIENVKAILRRFVDPAQPAPAQPMSGQPMATVQDIMTREVITVFPETEIVEATRLLLENRINGLPVVDADDRVVGILCQSDLIAQQKRLPLPSFFTFLDGFIPLTSTKSLERQIQKVAATTVGEVMTPNPTTVSPGTRVNEVAALMVDRNYHTIPVVQGDRLVGVVGKEDLLRTMATASR